MPHKNDPRRAANATRARVEAGQADRGHSTSPARRRRFVPAFPLTGEQVAEALEQADAHQLARALDPYYFDVNIRSNGPRFYCPVCNNHGAYPVDRWRWRCLRCPYGGRTGSWVALRQPVALDAEACIRLARIMYGEKVVGDAA